MPEFIGWEIDTLEKLEAAEFDDPYDRRRYFSAGDNQIAGVGDGFERNSPAWVETVKSLWPDFPVYGSMIECSECMTRLIGPQNHMLWMALEPERMGAVLRRVGQFYLDCAKAAIDAAAPWLDGFVIWGDVAYKKGTFMRPDYWRTHYKPWVKAIADHAHAKGLNVIYHGCGNVNAIFEDYIEAGIDAYNPLEVKAGMDVLDLRRRFGHRIGFCGNSDIQVWETGDRAGHPPRGAAQAQRGPRRRASSSSRTIPCPVRCRATPTTTSSSWSASIGRYPLQLGEFEEAVSDPMTPISPNPILGVSYHSAAAFAPHRWQFIAGSGLAVHRTTLQSRRSAGFRENIP